MPQSAGYVSISVFPKHGDDEFIIADIVPHNFDLGKIAGLLGIEDEFDFFGAEWEVKIEPIFAYLTKIYGIGFDPSNFAYYVGARSWGFEKSVDTRDNYRDHLGI